MKHICAWVLVALAAMILIAGCSGGIPNTPPIPSNTTENSGALTQSTSPEEPNHYLWGYYMVRIDEKDLSAEIIPIRATAGHWNVLKFLEQGPCTNCFKLAGITPNPDGTLNVNVSIKHPFSNKNLTGFDVRGIAMFNGSHQYPESGLIKSDRILGEGEVVDADGYTSLYNPTTVGYGFESYMKGKLATATEPTATLNGYKWFMSSSVSNTRNAFFAGEEILVTYKVDMPNAPNPWVFGCAVDASWAPPINKPVDDPMTDFGPEANCPEAWKIEVADTPVGNGLTDCSGQAIVTMDVYDWQGIDSTHLPTLECPELFDGEVTAAWKADGVGYTTYDALVENPKNAPAGTYTCLVSKEAQENDPATKPWLDITAYQLHDLVVVTETKNAPTAVVQVSQLTAIVGQPISFDASASQDNDCGNQSIVKHEWDWQNDGTFEDEGVYIDHSWAYTGGYYVQLRVTDDEGQTDTLDTPLKVTILPVGGSLNWAKSAGGAYLDCGNAITTLSDDSTVVTGNFEGSATFGPDEPWPTVLNSFGDDDIFIARYDPDGHLLWARDAGGTGYDAGYSVTALLDNSTVVTGSFQGIATFGPGEYNQTILFADGTNDMFIARYDPDGILIWAKHAGGTDFTIGNAITDLPLGWTIVTGDFAGSATFGYGEPNKTVLNSIGNDDIFIAQYDPYGTLEWAKSAGGIDYDGGTAITALSDGSTVVIGGFHETAIFGFWEPNMTVLVSDGQWDMFIARYNDDGTLAWAKSAGGSYDDSGHAITALSGDCDKQTVVTGRFQGSAVFGKGEPYQMTINSAGGYDVFIAQYRADGTLVEVRSSGGTDDDLPQGITVLSDNSTVVTGYFTGSPTFGLGETNETVLNSAGLHDIFIAGYYPDETLAWVKSGGGAENDQGWAITALSDDTTVGTGYFTGSATFGPTEPNEKVLTSAGAYDIFIARFFK
jgi:hypothetical protein